MSGDTPSPSLSQGATVAVTVLAAVVVWGARDVLAANVIARLVLPAVWLAAWTLACVGAGWPIVGRLRDDSGGRRTPMVVVVATGAAVLAFVGAVLALVHLFRPEALIAVFTIAAITGAICLRSCRGKVEVLPAGLVSVGGGLTMLPVLAVFLTLTAPPVMYDVLHYHLAFPQQWLLHGGFVEFARESFSYYFSAHGVLYAYALATVGPWGASAIGWWMAVVATVAAATLGGRFAGPSAAPWAAACYALTPAALATLGYANADHAVAAWCGAALVALTEDIDARPGARAFFLAGLLGGSAAAAKYLALAVVVGPLGLAAIGVGLFAAEGSKRKVVILLAILAGGVALPLAPWAGRNIAWTGNPVYPYLTDTLGGPPTGMSIAREEARNLDLPESTLGRALARVGALAYRTFRPRREGGLLGAHWLFLLPAAALLSGTCPRLRRPLWLATLSGVVVWGCLVQYARFLLPVLVGAAALAGAVPAAFARHRSRVVRFVVRGGMIALFTWNSSVILTGLNLEKLALVSGNLDTRDFRAHWIDVAPAADFVADHLPADARVLLVAESRCFGLGHRVLVEDPYRTPYLVELAESAASAEDLAARLRSLGVTHVLVNQGEMRRMAAMRGVSDYWAPASPHARSVIQSLFAHQVTRVFSAPGQWVGALNDAGTDRARTGS